MKNIKELLKQVEKVREANSYEHLAALNSDEQLDSRLNQLEINPDAAKEGKDTDQIGLERLIGVNNLMDINYLKKGLDFAKTVCRIIQMSGGVRHPIGSGFMVGPGLLMTNNHVIEDTDQASMYLAEFDYEYNTKGKLKNSYSFSLDPERFFITKVRLDYTVVGVNPIARNDSKCELEDFGYNLLKPIREKVIVGESLNIIQHPSGKPKMIAIRDNKVVDIDSSDVYYNTDTERGSSGSPVSNEQWEIVALHKAGVPAMNKAKEPLKIDGNAFQPGDDKRLIHWIANKGTLIDSILEDIYKQALPEHMQEDKKLLIKAYKLPPGKAKYKRPKKSK